MSILAVDVGTTSLKLGVYQNDVQLVHSFQQGYSINAYGGGSADIDPARWWEAFVAGCAGLGEWANGIDVIAFSGTTPALTPMHADGEPLLPAVLYMDARSREEAVAIRGEVGEARLLETTANLPVSGGCSLCTIVWIQRNHPEVFARTVCFGHSNTYMVKQLTGRFAIDPTSASLTCLYNTVANDCTWDEEIAGTFGLKLAQLPEVIPPYASAGPLADGPARELGLPSGVPVLIGGNNAVLAALSGGLAEPGEISNVNGTCEITITCLDECLPSAGYNIRTHVLPNRWVSFFVQNTGGKALEWFHETFCPDMTVNEFHREFVPKAVDTFLKRDYPESYVPYLAGSRYSLEPLKAAFSGVTLETTRERLLGALIRGNCEYQKAHLDELEARVTLANRIHVTGGGVSPALIRAKKRWMRDCEYAFQEQSSLRGAALLGSFYLDGTYG